MTDTYETTATVAEAPAAANGAVLFVPLNKLKKSPRNARKTPHSDAHIEALAASIAAKGMLQNLVVEPETNAEGEPTGFYFVTIGEGRRLAQRLRVKRKQIRKGEDDVNRSPLPSLRCLHLASDPVQLVDDEPVQQRGILEIAAPILGEEVTNDGAASLGIGFRPNETGAPITRFDVRLGQIAPDDPRLAVIGQVLEHLLLPVVILGDGEGHQLIERQTYLGRVTKTHILAAVQEGVGVEAAERIAGLKKPEMAQAAEQLLAGTGWLPSVLRTARPAWMESESEADAYLEAAE